MFEITKVPMEVEPGENGVQVTVHPEDLYPTIIARIQECLEGANPVELLATTERGGSRRADVLIKNARALPAEAWQDALRPREEFIALPYGSFVVKNGGINQVMFSALDSSIRAEVSRMINRGFALEVALGWFLHALRLHYGAHNTTITTGKNGNKAFRL